MRMKIEEKWLSSSFSRTEQKNWNPIRFFIWISWSAAAAAAAATNLKNIRIYEIFNYVRLYEIFDEIAFWGTGEKSCQVIKFSAGQEFMSINRFQRKPSLWPSGHRQAAQVRSCRFEARQKEVLVKNDPLNVQLISNTTEKYVKSSTEVSVTYNFLLILRLVIT